MTQPGVMRLIAQYLLPILPFGASAQIPARAEMEEFLSNASIGNERVFGHAMRITLDDGKRKHDATISTPDRNDLGNIYFDVAAYELDKALGLNLVAPSVKRTVKGQPAVLVWFVDDVAMMEVDRRRSNIQPPDPENWNQQMQAVRLFDELISNPWRSMNPATSSWQELLITSDWEIHLIDHRRAFRANRALENPETLTRCDRSLLAKLRELNKETLRQTLGKYASDAQLDTLEVRRVLLVKHFEELIAARGEAAVVYDLPRRP